MKSLAGVGRFRALTMLNIEGGAVTDLAPLAALKLVKLWASRNKLRSVQGLPTTLETLDVRDNAIATLDGVERLTKLDELYLDNNKLKSLPPLSKLKKLVRLHIPGNRIKRLENLEGLPALDVLEFEGAAVSSVSTATAAFLRSRVKTFAFQATAANPMARPEKWLAKQQID